MVYSISVPLKLPCIVAVGKLFTVVGKVYYFMDNMDLSLNIVESKQEKVKGIAILTLSLWDANILHNSQ
ncbi:hypothetical protein Riv7116_5769 [Rivularia sp. PCC 7116]|nr:hypothetical protein Riv7116_5769 [Rivularia sp. PCC 7116]